MKHRIATLEEVHEAARRIADAPRIAVDTEFHAERRYLPKLYLVQVHLEDGPTWLFDPLVPGVLEALGDAMRSVPWVLHGGHQDMRLLHVALGGLPDQILDTQIAAGLVDHRFPRSYLDLVRAHLGTVVEKTATLSDWSRRPLTAEQAHYAVEDVQLLLPLWDRIASEVSALGRLEHARAACAEARNLVLDPPSVDDAWRSISSASVLTPQQACVLQDLAAWREEIAQERDQPTRSIVGDAVLTQIARQLPQNVASLQNRRTPKAFVRAHGETVIARATRAAARPEWAWPTPVARGSALERVVTLLECIIEHEGHRERYAPRLVLPRRLIEDLAIRRPTDREALREHLAPWRDELCGDRVWQALEGRIALHVAGPDTAVQER